MARLILNPRAGRQRPNLQARIEHALRDAGIPATVAVTTEPGHAELLAREAAEAEHAPIIAAGGDGTVNEIVNGLLAARKDVPLGIIPTGTGNDLAFQLKLPASIEEQARVIAAGHARSMDLLIAGDRYVANCAGLAIEAHISALQGRLSRRLGRSRYLLATLMGIMTPPTWSVRLQWADGAYKGPITLLSVGNCPRTGGMFYTVPHANPWDEKLSFSFGHLPSRLGIARALAMILKPAEGSIAEHPRVREVHSSWLRVEAFSPLPIHPDGELLPEPVQRIEFRVHPRALRVFTPMTR